VLTCSLWGLSSAAREAVDRRYSAEAQQATDKKKRSILDHFYAQGIGKEQAVAELVLQM
jgi:hypothetical protein